MDLVQAEGIPLVQEWCGHLRASTPQAPAGTQPWPWFAKRFRAALNRPWEWRNGEKLPTEPFMRMFDGVSFYTQSQWLPGEAMEISADLASGVLNSKTGCTREPKLGYCCDNGRFYKHDNWPEGEPWRT